MRTHVTTQSAAEDELAELLSSDHGLKLTRLLAHADLIAAPSGSIAAPLAPDAPRAIGPWLPQLEAGELTFVREPVSDLDAIWWRPMAQREVIRPKRAADPTRVCVIGESAAAGMFYTPHYTPAIALADQLHAFAREPRYEVLDLTRNSMNASELLDTVRAALQLKPDQIVVYAGNNWFSGQGLSWEGEPEQRRDYLAALADHDLIEVVRTFQARVHALARRVVETLAAIVADTPTRLLILVPAVNLLWERAEPPVWLGRGRTAPWFALHAQATHALDRGDLPTAHEAVRGMLALDEGACPTSQRLSGKIWLALGQPEEAARAFEAELDHANAFELFSQAIPGTPLYARQAIAQAASAHALAYVDLPQVFAEHTGSPVDWSALFVDYCHLSPEGMRVAMTAAARSLLGLAPDAQLPAAPANPALTPRVDAVARFYSAVYASHMMKTALPFDAAELQSNISAALRACPELQTFALEYLRSRNGALVANPSLSVAACSVLMQSNNPFLDYAAVRGGTLDATTVQAIAAALDSLSDKHGEAALAEYFEFFARQLETGVDLSEPVHVERLGTVLPYLRYESERVTRRALPLYRALAPVSAFELATSKRGLRLTLTARIPGLAAHETAPAALALNGERFATVALGRSWQRHSLSVSPEHVQSGVSRVTVHWPPLGADDERAISAARERFVLGHRPDLFPVFGEIYACRAQYASAPPT